MASPGRRFEELDDAALEGKMFAPAGYNPPRSKPLPEWGISDHRAQVVPLAQIKLPYAPATEFSPAGVAAQIESPLELFHLT